MKEPSLSEIEGGTPDSGIGIDNMDGKFDFYIIQKHFRGPTYEFYVVDRTTN